jgi:carbon-monoxide dehydrogenase medium subunit
LRYFEYFQPTSLSEAISFLDSHRGECKVLAGGTDLLVRLKRWALEPRYVVNLKGVRGLAGIEVLDDGGLRIGALTTLYEVASSPLVGGDFEVLSQAAAKIGSVQVRNLATIGGNLCNASPSADMAPPLMALGARLVIQGKGGERHLPLEEFFLGAGETALGPDEVLTHILVPQPPPGTVCLYWKQGGRRAMDIAIVGVATALRRFENVCQGVRIVLGAVAPVPMRAKAAEALLEGKTLSQGLAMEAGRLASEEARPISDVRASEYYRRRLVAVLVRRLVAETWGIASEAGGSAH